MARPALPRGLRVFLDAVRGLAALEVVAHHLVSVNAYGGPVVLRDVFAFGQEAVMVFFLLSGFVVYANEFDRRGGVGAYLFRRLRRIYPPLVLALVLSIGVAAADRDLVAEFHPGQVLGTLVALQDNGALKPGVIVDPPFHNLALWSLSYEIAFYLVFPLLASALHRWPRLTPHLVGAAAAPSIAPLTVWGHNPLGRSPVRSATNAATALCCPMIRAAALCTSSGPIRMTSAWAIDHGTRWGSCRRAAASRASSTARTGERSSDTRRSAGISRTASSSSSHMTSDFAVK